MARPTQPPADTPIARLISRERQALGLSQAELGQRMGYKDGTVVSHFEQGKRVPRRDTCVKLARILKLDPSTVLRAAGHATVDDQEHAARSSAVFDAITADDLLTDGEKRSLLDLYRLFRSESGSRGGPAASSEST